MFRTLTDRGSIAHALSVIGEGSKSQVKFNDNNYLPKKYLKKFMRRPIGGDSREIGLDETGEYQEDGDYEELVEEEEEDDNQGRRESAGPIEITAAILKEIQQELCLIQLSWPEIVYTDDTDKILLPESYWMNNDKEKLLLWYAENFRKQYHTVYQDRKPLLLARDNEYGIQVGH